jgi:hypothetical protein
MQAFVKSRSEWLERGDLKVLQARAGGRTSTGAALPSVFPMRSRKHPVFFDSQWG